MDTMGHAQGNKSCVQTIPPIPLESANSPWIGQFPLKSSDRQGQLLAGLASRKFDCSAIKCWLQVAQSSLKGVTAARRKLTKFGHFWAMFFEADEVMAWDFLQTSLKETVSAWTKTKDRKMERARWCDSGQWQWKRLETMMKKIRALVNDGRCRPCQMARAYCDTGILDWDIAHHFRQEWKQKHTRVKCKLRLSHVMVLIGTGCGKFAAKS